MLSRTFCLQHKNGRFVCEPSVLCCRLAKATGAAKRSSAAVDFLLHGRFARESWRAGAADTGRDKAEEGGIPAVVFRPMTTQDVPASVRLRGCASRASRPFFLSRKKRRGEKRTAPYISRLAAVRGKGMAGIFIVTAVIILCMALLGKLTGKREKK